MKKKENELNEKKNDLISLKKKEKDDAINAIKKEVEKKIKQLEEEKAKKITYEEPIFIDTYDYTFLVCKRCKQNCDPYCDCFTIFGFKPNFLCKMIKGGYCLKCKCHTDYHKRGKFYYKIKQRQKSLSPTSKKKIN